MAEPAKRLIQVRLVAIVVVDITHPDLLDALQAHHRQPSAVAEVVADEVAANLESVSYIDAAVVSVL